MNVKQFSCLGRNGSSIELVVNDMIVLDFQCILKQNVDPELGLMNPVSASLCFSLKLESNAGLL